MTTIIMLLLFPIGIYTYFVVEKKDKRVYQQVFDDFQIAMNQDKNRTNQEQQKRFEEMLQHNGYIITHSTENSVIGEKKVLSMALIMIGIGIYIVGIFFYLAYYFWFQKPHVVKFEINA